MKLQVAKFQQKIKWKANASCTDLDELVQAAKMKLDVGLDKINDFMPQSCFHSWVKFTFVHTMLYNRDRPDDEPEMLCIVRMVLYLRVTNQLSVIYLLLYIDIESSYSSIRPISERCINDA